MRLLHVTCLTAILVAPIFLNGCGSVEKPKDVYDMGEKIKVGSLTYNVIEVKWREDLSIFPTNRIPERNFLLIRISVTNSGGTDRTVPGLTVLNSNGDSFTESPDGTGVDGWFGVIRRLAPAATDEGWLLFDVPTGSYKLRITDTEDDGTERASLVNIPLHLESDKKF